MPTRRSWAALLQLASACAPAATIQHNGADHARQTLHAMVNEHELPGAQYVAVDAQHTLLELDLGYADVLGARAMDRDTQQMAYSLTKVITAIAALQLVEGGELALERPLSDDYPAHPYGRTVTVGGLLAHTAGIPNPMPLDWFAVEGEALDREKRLERALQDNAELDREAGSAYRYSNLGYWLLEKAIEAASGRDYAAYVREHVFARVGVADSAAGFDLPAPEVAAIGHSRRLTP